jgi:hypothetical protein
MHQQRAMTLFEAVEPAYPYVANPAIYDAEGASVQIYSDMRYRTS